MKRFDFTIASVISLPVSIFALMLLSGCDLNAEQRQDYFEHSSNIYQVWQQQKHAPLTYRACGTKHVPCTPETSFHEQKETQ